MQDQANLLWAIAALGVEPSKRVLKAAVSESRAGVHGAGSAALIQRSIVQVAEGCGLGEDGDGDGKGEGLGDDAPHVLEQYRQIHAFLLVHEIEGWKDPGQRVCRLRSELGDRGRRALAVSEVSERRSVFQRQVASAIEGIGHSIEEESRCPVSGYSLDILVMLPGRGVPRGHDKVALGPGDVLAAVEVNGPTHYLAGGSRVENGATALKRKILTGLGWKLLTVPFWEWDRGSDEASRQEYVRGLLLSKAGEQAAATA